MHCWLPACLFCVLSHDSVMSVRLPSADICTMLSEANVWHDIGWTSVCCCRCFVFLVWSQERVVQNRRFFSAENRTQSPRRQGRISHSPPWLSFSTTLFSCLCCYTVVLRTYDDRALSVPGLRVWNYLPTDLRQPDLSCSRFMQSLKTFLFGHGDQSTVWIPL